MIMKGLIYGSHIYNYTPKSNKITQRFLKTISNPPFSLKVGFVLYYCNNKGFFNADMMNFTLPPCYTYRSAIPIFTTRILLIFNKLNKKTSFTKQ